MPGPGDDTRGVSGVKDGQVCGTRRRSSSTPPPLTAGDRGHQSGILGSPVKGRGKPVACVVAISNNDFLDGTDDVYAGDDTTAGAKDVGAVDDKDIKEVRRDTKGRVLAACGCLQRTSSCHLAVTIESAFYLLPGSIIT